MESGPALKADNEQAVRYVAGYVAMALKKKYAKLPNDTTAVQYLNCLTTMHELDEENDRELPGFLECTKLWVEKVNRGGLFLVDDKTFLLSGNGNCPFRFIVTFCAWFLCFLRCLNRLLVRGMPLAEYIKDIIDI